MAVAWRWFMYREIRLRSHFGCVLALHALLALSACSIGGESGIEPPLDRIFLPTGAVVDGSGRWLLVVNSNSDLRYSFGTVVPLDLVAAREDLNHPLWPICPAEDYRPLRNEGRKCCRDPLDVRVLNCDDRPYALPAATVRVGSFATTPVMQSFERDGKRVDRMFFGVRADPSITFVDVTTGPDGLGLRCTGNPNDINVTGERNSRCDKNFRVEKGVLGGNDVLLPEEPFSLKLDPTLNVLYVGHLFGGLSAIDVCAPGISTPRLGSVVRRVYGEEAPATGVTAIAPSLEGDPLLPVFTTAREGVALGQLFFRAGAQAAVCDPAAPRDLTLVPAPPLAANTFEPRGSETRGLVYQRDKNRAFVLHRNSGGNPAALARMNLGLDTRQQRQFEPSAAIDVCAGPGELHLHDAGRGNRLYIPCFDSGQVYVVDPDLMVVTEIIEVGRGPSSLTFDPNLPTVAYVIGYVDNNISVLDLRPGSATEGIVVQRIGFARTSREL